MSDVSGNGPYRMEVWREGSRIRQASGTGYSDLVPDGDITAHIASDTAEGRFEAVTFAAAVLSLRARERAAAAARQASS